MELYEFIKSTLLQVTKGIKEAQEEVKEYGAIVNPRIVKESSHAEIDGSYHTLHEIQFEVGLTESTEDINKKGIGVLLGGFKIGFDGNDSKNISAVTNIKFTIPIVYPEDAVENKNKVKKSVQTVSITNKHRY